ncbi:MAG: hypothetical protein P8Y71_23715 [Pseudolabrys sp.]
MTAAEFFQQVVKQNCLVARKNPKEYRHLWNAIVSMNTVAEYLALDGSGRTQMPGLELATRANQIRDKTKHLSDLKECAEHLKHVRKIVDRKGGEFEIIGSSTGHNLEDPTTWWAIRFNLKEIMEAALAELEKLPELDPDPSC